LFAAGFGAAGAEGKVLQISAGGSDISTLDAHRATSTTDKALVGWMYNGLVRFPPGSKWKLKVNTFGAITGVEPASGGQ
jgi:peptide/nickel transport system substrate-binding protein